MVTLIGEGITVDELAHHFGTIGYEVLTSLGRATRASTRAATSRRHNQLSKRSIRSPHGKRSRTRLEGRPFKSCG